MCYFILKLKSKRIEKNSMFDDRPFYSVLPAAGAPGSAGPLPHRVAVATAVCLHVDTNSNRR